MSISQGVATLGALPGLSLRAWALVSFTAVNGAQTILKGAGVASISRTAVGVYTVTFSTAMPDLNGGVQFYLPNDTQAGSVNRTTMSQATVSTAALGVFYNANPIDCPSPMLLGFYW